MANKNEVTVNRETVIRNVEVREGNKVFNIFRNPKGVMLTVGKSSITIPNTEVGNAVVKELVGMFSATEAPKAKRKRRSKAEMEAANAEESIEAVAGGELF